MRARVLAVVTMILGLGYGSLSAQWWGSKAPQNFHHADNDDKCGHDRDRWGRDRDRHDNDQCCDDDHDGKRDRDDDRWGRGHDHDDDKCGSSGSGNGGGTQATGSISGAVSGSNGPVSGWTVYLISASSSTSTTTNASGAYSFANLAAGTYLVCESDPGSDQEELPANGSSASAAPCSTGAAYGFSLTLTAGGTLSGNNFVNGAGGLAF